MSLIVMSVHRWQLNTRGAEILAQAGVAAADVDLSLVRIDQRAIVPTGDPRSVPINSTWWPSDCFELTPNHPDASDIRGFYAGVAPLPFAICRRVLEVRRGLEAARTTRPAGTPSLTPAGTTVHS
jgi:hypothetical protein